MRFHSLESRIVALFVVLILLVQLVGFFAIHNGITDNAHAAISDELVFGQKIFQRLLEQNANRLTQGAQLLAKDYGFLQAIGTNDDETIASSLSDQRADIGASLALLVAPDHQIKAATAPPAANLAQTILHLVDQAEQRGSANGISIVDNDPYQVVVVPIKAPVTIGWVAMVFPIDQRLAADMNALSGLQVSILTRGKTGQWTADASTLAAADVASLTGQLNGSSANITSFSNFAVSGNEFSARIVPLAPDSAQSAIVVLQRSISEAIAPYTRLQVKMLILTALGIAIAVAGSIFTAKRITGPLRRLTEIAKRLGAGTYEGQIEIQREDEIGELSKAFASMRDGIANRELEIRRLAYWDTLTDLPNRAQFAIMLTDAIAQAGQSNSACTILMMDLDRFKTVNDVMGHRFGDALLRLVAERLALQLPNRENQLARLGGDEFAILLPDTNIDDARRVAVRILKALEVPLSLEEQTVDLGAGIGIAGYPAHGADAELLLSRAEVAMYAAKRSGNEAVVYDAILDKVSQQSLSLLSELRAAIDGNQFRLYVQPKIMLETGEVTGLEALVRWAHPDKGMIFPDHFIPFAEQTGFIRVLTRWVLDRSAALCSELAAQGVRLKISINLSARDLLDLDLPAKFAEILARHHVESSSFCLEITESAIMDDPQRAQQTLEGLHAMGVDLSIDDFGTGYSSLAYLKRLPVDELKIDKSFVMNMERDADDAKIVRSTIDLGHNMGLRVVAEGIESEAVWNILVRMGCDQGQGYFMSRPIPSDQLIAWKTQWLPPHGTQEPDAAARLA